jgi:putative oxidoreductase
MTDIGAVDAAQPVIPSLGKIWARLDGLTQPIVRIAVGGFMIPHGLTRVLSGGIGPTAEFMAKTGLEPAYGLTLYVTSLEVIGGSLLALGLFTRPIALLVLGFMGVAAMIHLQTFGYFWIAKGCEMPLFWGAMAFTVLVKGGGRYSLDHYLGYEV